MLHHFHLLLFFFTNVANSLLNAPLAALTAPLMEANDSPSKP